ncbi:MAG: phage tail tape measure protein [Gammaproteobacteria bacterium]
MAVDAGSIFSEVRVSLDKLRADLSKVDARFGKFAQTNQQQSNKVQGFWTKSFGKISAGGIAAFAGIGLAVKSAVKTFAGFEQSLANVESVAGATASEMDELRAAAIRAGEQTRFTASEAADAMYYLASAGFDASESVSALDGVLSLATATQSDLASTSASVAASISQFGLDASAASLVANVFAAAIGNSQANMEKLTNSMRNVGPVAGALGKSIEETVGVLQVLYDAGFQGEQAGVALRNIFISLASKSDPITQRLMQLGLTFEELNPQANSFAEIVDNINAKIEDPAQALEAFDKRTGPQLISLLKAGGEAINEYTTAVTGTNKAVSAAATQLDTLQGSFDLLKSAAQSAAINIISELQPAIRGLVDFIRGLIERFNGLPGPLKAFTGAAVIAIPVIGALAAAVAALQAAASGGLTLILAGVAGGIAAIASASAKAKQAKVDELFGDVSERLKGAAENGEDLVEAIKEISRETGLSVDQVINLAEEHGLVTSEISQQVALLRESNAELDENAKTAKEIVKENEYIRANLATAANSMGDMGEIAQNYARNMNVSLERVISIAQTLNNLTPAQEEQLRLLKLQAEEWAKIREEDIASLERASGRAGERERAAAAARAEAEADAEALRIDTLRAQIEDEYKAARAKVLEVIDAERSEVDKIREQVDYLNAHPWSLTDAEGRRLDADRIKALEILNQQLIAAQNETSEAANAQEEFRKKIEEIGIEERELLDLEESRALASAELYEGTADEINDARKAISDYYDLLRKVRDEEANEEAAKTLEHYSNLLLEKTELDKISIENERQKAIEAVRGLNASDIATEQAIDKINEYYDSLQKRDAWDRFIENANSIIGPVSSILDAVGGLYDALAQQQIDALDRELQARLESLGIAEETTLESLQRQLDEAIAAGDMETAADLEDEIQREEITKEYEQKKATIQYQADLKGWRLKLLSAIASGALAITNAFATRPFIPAGLIAGSLATALTGVQIATVKAQKPQPPGFQTGGIVIGGAGSAGRDVRVAEGSSNELLLNDSPAGQSFLNQFAERVADVIAGRIGQQMIQLNHSTVLNGRVLTEEVVQYIDNGKVRMKALQR